MYPLYVINNPPLLCFRWNHSSVIYLWTFGFGDFRLDSHPHRFFDRLVSFTLQNLFQISLRSTEISRQWMGEGISPSHSSGSFICKHRVHLDQGGTRNNLFIGILTIGYPSHANDGNLDWGSQENG